MDKQSTDLIWDTITESAKTRFDYNSYASDFDMFGNEKVPENILFKIILGYVEGLSNAQIQSEINTELVVLGFSFEDDSFDQFLLNKQDVFVKEILATNTALALLEQGRQIPGVLVQVKRILMSE